MVLNDYRLRSDLPLTRRSYRSCINCSVKMEKSPLRIYLSSLKGSSTPGTACWKEDLPDEIADGELEEVEATRNRELLRKESQQIGNKVKEASSIGDAEKALLELERLIAQKKNGVGMAKEQKDITTLDVQIAEFIREPQEKWNCNR